MTSVSRRMPFFAAAKGDETRVDGGVGYVSELLVQHVAG